MLWGPANVKAFCLQVLKRQYAKFSCVKRNDVKKKCCVPDSRDGAVKTQKGSKCLLRGESEPCSWRGCYRQSKSQTGARCIWPHWSKGKRKATLVQGDQLLMCRVLNLQEDAVMKAWTRHSGKSAVCGAVSGGMQSPGALCPRLQCKVT